MLHERNSDFLCRHMAFEEDGALKESVLVDGRRLELGLVQTGNRFDIHVAGLQACPNFQNVWTWTLLAPFISVVIFIVIRVNHLFVLNI